MATCKDCLHYDVCKNYGVIMRNSLKLKMTEGVESKCPYKLFKSRTIKTNADSIRAMSDEELAELLHSIIHERDVIMIDKLKNHGIEASLVEAPILSVRAHLGWLKQPAEE